MNDNEKRKEIRQKALLLFKQHGFEGVTVQMIAKASHVSKNTFYYYYETKEDLIKEIFTPQDGAMEAFLMKLLTLANFQEQMRFALEHICETMEQLGKEVVKQALVMNLTTGLMGEKPHSHDQLKHKEMANMLKAMMIKGQKDGLVRKDIDGKAMHDILVTSFIGCLHLWANTKELDSLTHLFIPIAQKALGINLYSKDHRPSDTSAQT